MLYPPFFWESVAVIATAVLLHSSRRNLLVGEYIIGVCYGVLWEFSAQNHFNYQGFTLYIQTVPIAIPLLWGVVIASFVLISDSILQYLKTESLSIRLITDIIVAGTLGISMEYLGSHQLDLWSYPPSVGCLPILDVPFAWVKGWIIVGITVVTIARVYDEIIDQKVSAWLLRRRNE